MPEHQHLDHIDAHIMASARPVRVGAGGSITAHGGVDIGPAPNELFEREEIHLEDIVVEIRATNVPVVVGLGAVVYLHPGVSVQRVTIGGTAYLAKGAVVEDLDELALARAEATIAQWRTVYRSAAG